MKKKRRFINWGTMFLLSVIVGIVAYTVAYGCFINNCSYVLKAYSKDDYDYLVEIAEKTITEGKGINTEKIPKDCYYSIEQLENSDEITVEYRLKNQSDGFLLSLLSPDKGMVITLSKDNKILSAVSLYESEETYITMCKRSMLFFSVMVGGIVWILMLLVAYIIMSKVPEK